MQSMLINIVLIALVLIPMAYFMFGSNKNKALIINFKKKAEDKNFRPTDVCVLKKGIIGFDKKNDILCWQFSDGEELEFLSLSELADITVAKSYQNHIMHGAETGTLTSVVLSLQKKDKKNLVLPIFNESEGHLINNDLLDVTGFTNNVRQHLVKG